MLAQTTAKYITPASNAIDPWEVVSGALADEGITTPRRPPAASLAFRPRHQRTAAGSDTAQQDLQSLAGWSRPTRRGVLAGLLAVAAAPAAAALPEIAPVPDCAPAPAAGVSPRMMQLIADFTRLTTALYAVEFHDDPAAWNRAAEERRPVLEDLVFERPASVVDLAAKMSALAEFMAEEDSELFTFRRLAEDATMLAGSAAK